MCVYLTWSKSYEEKNMILKIINYSNAHSLLQQHITQHWILRWDQNDHQPLERL